MQQWDLSHRKGALHHVPDALSRMYEKDEIVKVASFSEEIEKRDRYVNMLKKVAKTSKKYKSWKIEEGQLYKYHTSVLLDPVLSCEEFGSLSYLKSCANGCSARRMICPGWVTLGLRKHLTASLGSTIGEATTMT